LVSIKLPYKNIMLNKFQNNNRTDDKARRLVYLAGRTDEVELELEEDLQNETVDVTADGWVF